MRRVAWVHWTLHYFAAMPDNEVYGFDETDVKRVIAAIRRLEGQMQNLALRPPHVAPIHDQGTIEGLLTSAITPATNGGQTSTTAQLQVYRGRGDDEWAISDGEIVTLTIRSTKLVAPIGTYVQATEINGEMKPIWVDC